MQYCKQQSPLRRSHLQNLNLHVMGTTSCSAHSAWRMRRLLRERRSSASVALLTAMLSLALHDPDFRAIDQAVRQHAHRSESLDGLIAYCLL